MTTAVEVLAAAFRDAGTPFIVGHPGGKSVELMEAARQRQMRFLLTKQDVVSNHGGRQLDGASSSILLLPAIVDAVGSEIETMFDGGIRTGMDIMRALALGAKICLVGRPYAWGVGAGGKVGVAKAIEILAKELDVTMALCGYKRVIDVNREAVGVFQSRQTA
jgi:isopentenyl diphosphate isomerase/L-lactate dehydrogenase-like FMN-dependent dehydrogenase